VPFATGDPRWMTYHQAQENGYQVRKDEKSTTIFFTKRHEIEDQKAEDGKKLLRFLKHYAVFHASQIDGLPSYLPPVRKTLPGLALRPQVSS